MSFDANRLEIITKMTIIESIIGIRKNRGIICKYLLGAGEAGFYEKCYTTFFGYLINIHEIL